MPTKPFAELTKQVHLLNDLILSDMVCDNGKYAEESLIFNKRLFILKNWFVRISWANKRLFILTLLHDLRSVWALSLLLKSLWNCRTKDAVQSASKLPFLSVYDRTPMDHDRTALPPSELGQVMTHDRKWFHTLEPENQAQVLAELLTIAGGPIMWEVLSKGQQIYEHHKAEQQRNLLECVVNAPATTIAASKSKMRISASANPVVANRRASRLSGVLTVNPVTIAQRELEQKLVNWNDMMKKLRESQKFEEQELSFYDGTKKKIWKVQRNLPESCETLDFIQLLPSHITKRIFGYLDSNELVECSKVNRYWTYIIEELRNELAAKVKSQSIKLALQADMLKHDVSLEVIAPAVTMDVDNSAVDNSSRDTKRVGGTTSHRPSERSAAVVSFRQMMLKKKPAYRLKSKPIRKLADLEGRLMLHGAADENIWKWCKNVIRLSLGRYSEEKPFEGVLRLGELHFPCPLMKYSVEMPLPQVLSRDPSRLAGPNTEHRRNLTYDWNLCTEGRPNQKIKLWSRNFSSLYKVKKVASYQSPKTITKITNKK